MEGRREGGMGKGVCSRMSAGKRGEGSLDLGCAVCLNLCLLYNGHRIEYSIGAAAT